MNSFIDIHHHLLFGLDDGPEDRLKMENMIRAAYCGGVRAIIATPHIAPGIGPFSAEIIRIRVWEAQMICKDMGIGMRILPGAEVMYTYQTERYLAENQIPTLADSNKILVEFSPEVSFGELESAVGAILRTGHIPVLAHIERYACLMNLFPRAFRLKKKYDVQYQINCECLLDNVKYATRQTIRRLLLEERIDYVASDAHDVDQRSCRMQEAFHCLSGMVGASYAAELTGNHRTWESFCNK